jgi:hypothetical protein
MGDLEMGETLVEDSALNSEKGEGVIDIRNLYIFCLDFSVERRVTNMAIFISGYLFHGGN